MTVSLLWTIIDGKNWGFLQRMEGTFTGKNKYVLWALIALELFMSFSFLGYIHIDPISITFVYIPVLAAGCLMGPKEATLVGTHLRTGVHVEGLRLLCGGRGYDFFTHTERETPGEHSAERGIPRPVRIDIRAALSVCQKGKASSCQYAACIIPGKGSAFFFSLWLYGDFFSRKWALEFPIR